MLEMGNLRGELVGIFSIGERKGGFSGEIPSSDRGMKLKASGKTDSISEGFSLKKMIKYI